jgi:hypothetical protein
MEVRRGNKREGIREREAGMESEVGSRGREVGRMR